MDIRLISRSEEHTVERGKVVRVTHSRVQVKSPDGLLHWCGRHNGAGLGQLGAYSIHPDDVPQLQAPELDGMGGKAPRKQRSQFANHWNV